MNDRDLDLFDEAGYLRLYPGLADAIEAGRVESGWDHYDKHGRREGRMANDVDADFYLAAYPGVALDLGRLPDRGDAAAHFVRFGRARGYLANAAAPRPDNAAAIASAFGGLWTDRPDALDAIQNRFDLGRITDKQAERLRIWVREGYVMIDLGSANDRVDPAAFALEQIFAGVVPGALFRCPALDREAMAWVAELPSNPGAALDVHVLSKAVRSLILAPLVVGFLTALFDSPLRIGASEGVLRPVVRGMHQDSALSGHSSQRMFTGLWFGLDDPASGEAMAVYPGSHRLPDFLYGGRYKSLEEARRMGVGGLENDEARHLESLRVGIGRLGLTRTPLTVDHGSVVVWHPDLVREVPSVTGFSIRRGIAALVSPRYATPLHAEVGPVRLDVQDGHLFSSAVYPDREPLD